MPEYYIRFIITKPEGCSPRTKYCTSGHDILMTSKSYLYSLMKPQTTKCTYQTMVHVSNLGVCITFMALSEALKGCFIMTFYIIINMIIFRLIKGLSSLHST